jgi:hypothetical protein
MILSRRTDSKLAPIWTAARPSDLTYHTSGDDGPLGIIASDQHVDPADGEFVERRNLAALPAAERVLWRPSWALTVLDRFHRIGLAVVQCLELAGQRYCRVKPSADRQRTRWLDRSRRGLGMVMWCCGCVALVHVSSLRC